VFAEEPPSWSFDLGASVTCERCGEEPASVHLLRVVDGAVTHTHLCPLCAEGIAEETEGLALVLAVPSVLSRLGRGSTSEEQTVPTTDAEGSEHFCGSAERRQAMSKNRVWSAAPTAIRCLRSTWRALWRVAPRSLNTWGRSPAEGRRQTPAARDTQARTHAARTGRV